MLTLRYHDVVYKGVKFKLTSVTSLISVFADADLLGADFMPQKSKAEGIGTEAHWWIDAIIKGKKITDIEWANLSLSVQNTLNAYLSWKRQRGFRPRESEFVVYSLTHAYAGKVDAIGTIKQHVALRDWVSAEPRLERKKLQVASYAMAYLEMFPLKTIHDAGIVWLNKRTGSFVEYIMEKPEIDTYFGRFLDLKRQIGIV